MRIGLVVASPESWHICFTIKSEFCSGSPLRLSSLFRQFAIRNSDRHALDTGTGTHTRATRPPPAAASATHDS